MTPIMQVLRVAGPLSASAEGQQLLLPLLPCVPHLPCVSTCGACLQADTFVLDCGCSCSLVLLALAGQPVTA